MHLYDVPLYFALIGLVLYTVLGGADFGAGLWQLIGGRGEEGVRIRDHAHNSMAAVWEANHVWLIFVLTVIWTAYPEAFGAIASTLSVALFIAALGIIFRGAAYALRAGSATPRESRNIDTVTAVASIITPFALGAAVGGIASGRVPVGNAAGDLITSWLNPTSILIGVLAVVTAAYLAAVYLAADAVRLKEPGLERAFRTRALVSGILAGAVALGGLAVLDGDAPRLFDGLTSGDGLPALVASIVAGVATLSLVWLGRYEPARYGAAAPDDTLIAVVVAVVAGAAILFPSLGLLFRLVLGGRLDHGEPTTSASRPARAVLSASASGLLARSAGACFIAGLGFLTAADAGWAHAVGVVALLAFIALGFLAVAPQELARGGPDDASLPEPASRTSRRPSD
jgi:cytochrome d ubiquinol oxidase subunit II